MEDNVQPGSTISRDLFCHNCKPPELGPCPIPLGVQHLGPLGLLICYVHSFSNVSSQIATNVGAPQDGCGERPL